MKKIKILDFQKNFVHTGEDKFILDCPIKDLCSIISANGWEVFHRNTGDKLVWCVAYHKEVDGLQVQLFVDINDGNKNQTQLICREWFTKQCKKIFNLVK